MIVPVIMLLMVLGFVFWMAVRRAGKMSRVSVMEAALGFLGWFAINTYLAAWAIQNTPGIFFISPLAPIPFLVTITLLLVLYFTRPSIAAGMLAAIVANTFGTLLFTAPGPIVDRRFAKILGMFPFYLSYFLPGS